MSAPELSKANGHLFYAAAKINPLDVITDCANDRLASCRNGTSMKLTIQSWRSSWRRGVSQFGKILEREEKDATCRLFALHTGSAGGPEHGPGARRDYG
jgi:hypothetical protein